MLRIDVREARHSGPASRNVNGQLSWKKESLAYVEITLLFVLVAMVAVFVVVADLPCLELRLARPSSLNPDLLPG